MSTIHKVGGGSGKQTSAIILLEAEIERLHAENARLRGLMRDAVDGWDWWMVETYSRCSTVPGEAIENMRAALEEKP